MRFQITFPPSHTAFKNVSCLCRTLGFYQKLGLTGSVQSVMILTVNVLFFVSSLMLVSHLSGADFCHQCQGNCTNRGWYIELKGEKKTGSFVRILG